MQQTDHFAGDFFQADLAADRILRTEQFFPHRFTDHADAHATAQFAAGKKAARLQFPVANGEVTIVATGDIGGPVFVTVDHHHRLRCGRCYFGHAWHFTGDRFDVSQLKRRRLGTLTVTETLADGNEQQVAAKTLDLLFHLQRGATAEVDHDDHRGYADDDAESGEERTQHVAPYGAHRQQQGIPQHQCAPPCCLSSATRPSRKLITRWA